MKRYLTLLLLTGSIYFTGCEEDEKIRFPDTTTGIVPVVTVQPGREVFDSTNKAGAEIAFDLTYDNFGGNLQAESIVVKVSRVAAINAAEASPAAATARVYTTVTQFPSTVTISLAQVASLFGIADVNSILASSAIDVNFEVRATNGATYSVASNNNAGVNTTYGLGTFRRRFFIGCASSIAPGRYTAQASVRVGPNGPVGQYTNEVELNRQVVALTANTWLNFLPDMYTLTDLSGGFYENNPAFPGTARNQPIGFREVCGTFSLFNNALLTLPSPFPQRTFTITGGSWNPAASTLTLTWRDGAANGATTVFGTTTFVRTGD